MFVSKKNTKKVTAGDELDNEVMEPEMDEDVVDDTPDVDEDVNVAPEATDLLFEAEDVAQLVAEVTGQPVDVDTAEDGSSVEFTVGEDVFTVTAEGDEEVLEAVRKPLKKKKPVSASTNRKPAGKTVRKLPSKK